MTPLAIVLEDHPKTRSGKEAIRSLYILEVLEHAGIFFDIVAKPQLRDQKELNQYRILLLPYDMKLDSEEKQTIADFVGSGHGLIGIGGSSGLDPIFGCESKSEKSEGEGNIFDGYIRIVKPHPITSNLDSSLHFFGGSRIIAKSGTTILAKAEAKDGAFLGEAIIERGFGQGIAILLAPDLLNSIVHIQQGINIISDGLPAPDGSAPINDGVLKAEDGLVLDWEKDRKSIGAEGHKIFLEPITDELRELIIKSIFYCCFKLAIPLPMLWYWPKGLDAVGLISHDSDGNDPSKAWSLHNVMKKLNVKSCWCIIYPGGYAAEFYEILKADGYEIASHYDARTGGALTTWSEANFKYQFSWLQQEANLSSIPSNKNHYTRWEGRLEFFRWCESVNIRNEQSKGPSKLGIIGFPFGGSQPWFPIDDEGDGRRLDVLEINLMTQDLTIFGPAYFGKPLLDSALKHHGVAHFLFHPAHIEKPGVAEALTEVVEYGRQKQIEWWTSEEIGKWERKRRKVIVGAQHAAPNGEKKGEGRRAKGEIKITRINGIGCEVELDEDLRNAALLFLLPSSFEGKGKEADNFSIQVNGKRMEWSRVNRYGFDLAQVILNKNA